MHQYFYKTFAATAALLVTACAVPGAPVTSPPLAQAPQQTCKAEPAASFVGKAATATVVEQARQTASARLARVLRPGQAVTMEFMADRLNLDANAAGVITRVRCG